MFRASAGAFSAMASRLQTPASGFSSSIAIVFAQVTPTRRPVKEPGPWLTAIRSTSRRLSQPAAAITWSTSDMSMRPCSMPRSREFSASTVSSRQAATDPIGPLLSIPSTFMSASLFNQPPRRQERQERQERQIYVPKRIHPWRSWRLGGSKMRQVNFPATRRPGSRGTSRAPCSASPRTRAPARSPRRCRRRPGR